MDAAPISCYKGQHLEPTEVVCDAKAELLKQDTEEETRIRKETEIVIDDDYITFRKAICAHVLPNSMNALYPNLKIICTSSRVPGDLEV
jgi:hypothetical protein